MITLSVVMITYNHEAFIEQAIHGVLSQETTFDFELIIANDNSKDKTHVNIVKLLNAHSKSKIIKYFNRNKNLKMYGNVMDAFSKCSGKYIALCEGDDYWTDPYKLQKQVNFLETNPDFEVCFTNIKVIRADGSIKKEQLITDGRKDVYEQKDLPIWAPTLTRVFRNRDFQGKLPNAPGLDTVMLLYQSQFGKIKFINEVTGVYRLHEGGIHSSKSVAKKKENMFVTDLHCLSIAPPELLPKYFGMMLKKLIALKTLDEGLYKKCHPLFMSAFAKYQPQLSNTTIIKIKSAIILVRSQLFQSRKTVQSLKFKCINKLLVDF